MTESLYFSISDRILHVEGAVAELAKQLRNHLETSADDEYFSDIAEELLTKLEVHERHLESLQAAERVLKGDRGHEP